MWSYHLAGPLAVVPHIPIQTLALLLGIDRFMSECRALTDVIGNGAATIVVSRWEKDTDAATIRHALRQPHDLPPSRDRSPQPGVVEEPGVV